jgi:hypothetical protein
MWFGRFSQQTAKLPYTALADWFCITELESVYCAVRMSPCTTQTLLVFKGLISGTNLNFTHWQTNHPNVARQTLPENNNKLMVFFQDPVKFRLQHNFPILQDIFNIFLTHQLFFFFFKYILSNLVSEIIFLFGPNVKHIKVVLVGPAWPEKRPTTS